MWARNKKGIYLALAMSEELKVAETEGKAAEQEEGSGEEISEDDLEGVAGGGGLLPFMEVNRLGSSHSGGANFL